jgi:kumamolisin
MSSGRQWIPIPGSGRQVVSGAKYISPVQSNDEIRVTVILRRRGNEPSVPSSGKLTPRFTSREQFSQNHGADPKDVAALEKFAHAHHLTVAERHDASRRLVLAGPAHRMQEAFQVELGVYDVPQMGLKYRGRHGDVCLPEDLQPGVIAVLGLDNRPIAKPHFRRRKPKAAAVSFTPLQIASLYQFPSNLTGEGQTIAIIELGGGYQTSDLDTYFSNLGLKNNPSVTAVSVDGGANSPGGSDDGEVMLDIEIAGAIAPGANIAVYFAPNTDQGFVDAISQAIHDTTRKPSIISISWGAPEDSWTAQSRDAMNAALQDAAALGVTVTVAAGDSGSTDGESDNEQHVDFPAASPYSLACGGTTLKASGNTISSETVWNELSANEGATGGGVSRYFALPDYQKNADVPVQPDTKFAGRGTPDVSGNADPSTGYSVLIDGQNEIIGGTSAVAPLWAGLIALINQKLGQPVGFLNPLLYPLGSKPFYDITKGNNGYYNAAVGWDPCTGMGSPNGAALLTALEGSARKSTSA